MSFGAPWCLLLLLLPLAAAALGWWRARRAAALPLPAVLRALVGGNRVRVADAGAVARRPWRLWLALAALAAGLARPHWGRPEAAPLAPGQIVIALDLSRSMLAEDVPPSRLERARALAGRLVEARGPDRIGLVGFAGDAYLFAPPSADHAVLRAFLPTLAPEHVARAGTDFARLLPVAAAAFDPRAGGARTLVLLSDGEAEPTAWRARLGDLAGAGVRVVAYGLGTAGGAPLRADGQPVVGPGGRPVVSRLQPATLRALADATGGAYLDAGHGDLVAAVAAAAARAPAGRDTGSAPPERFCLFLAAAALLLAWSIAAEWPALPRLRRRLAGGAALAALAAGAPLVPAGSVRRIDPELHGMEPDPLLVMKRVVAATIAKPAPDADDYQRLADTAVRYGEVHRGHAHPLALGVLRDGLVAIEAGRRLDPARPAWAFDRVRLVRLLQSPRPPRDLRSRPGDPADDPADVPGARQAEQDRQRQAGGADRDRREVGGAKRDVYDRREWQVASLVRPLSLMQRVRAQDVPAELVRRMAGGAGVRRGGQTW